VDTLRARAGAGGASPARARPENTSVCRLPEVLLEPKGRRPRILPRPVDERLGEARAAENWIRYFSLA